MDEAIEIFLAFLGVLAAIALAIYFTVHVIRTVFRIDDVVDHQAKLVKLTENLDIHQKEQTETLRDLRVLLTKIDESLDKNE